MHHLPDRFSYPQRFFSRFRRLPLILVWVTFAQDAQLRAFLWRLRTGHKVRQHLVSTYQIAYLGHTVQLLRTSQTSPVTIVMVHRLGPLIPPSPGLGPVEQRPPFLSSLGPFSGSSFRPYFNILEVSAQGLLSESTLCSTP